jgi:hypothetical protein
MVHSRDFVLEMLRNSSCDIQFTKVDGTLRKMNCTLHEDLLPHKTTTDEKTSTRKENVDIQSVFDLDLGDWRSFRWDSLQSIEKNI